MRKRARRRVGAADPQRKRAAVFGEELLGVIDLEMYAHWIGEGLTALEAMAKAGAGRFLFGDAPTIADVCLVPQLFNARRFNVFVQGQQVLTNFDLFAISGQSAPVTRVYTNALTSTLNVQFAPVNYLARAAGIQVRRIADIDTDSDGMPDWWMRGHFDHPTGQSGDRSLAGSAAADVDDDIDCAGDEAGHCID